MPKIVTQLMEGHLEELRHLLTPSFSLLGSQIPGDTRQELVHHGPSIAWHGMPEMIHTNIRTFFADTSCLGLPQCFCSDVTGVDGMDGWMDGWIALACLVSIPRCAASMTEVLGTLNA